MSDEVDPRFDPGKLRVDTGEAWAVVPKKIKKRREQFIMVPCAWIEKLAKSRSANTYRVALNLLYLHWKDNGDPIKLANGMLAMSGVTRFSKWRALRQLERAGLIKIERRPRRSPVIVVVL